MVPATAENGEKFTVQLAKIITIPAHQLAQCQLQTSTGTAKPGSPAGISLLGGPLTVRALAPGAQVVRLTVPTQPHQQTLVVSQPGSIACSSGVVTVTTSSHTSQPHIISGIFNGSELVIGGPAAGRGVATPVQVQAVPVSARQNQVNPKVVDAEVLIKLERNDVALDLAKTEDPEC